MNPSSFPLRQLSRFAARFVIALVAATWLCGHTAWAGPRIHVSVSPTTITEGDTATFTFTASAVATSPIVVRYTFLPGFGNASFGSDFLLFGGIPGAVVIPKGAHSASVVLYSLIDDDNVPRHERATLLLLDGGAKYLRGVPSSVTLTIDNFDG